MAQWARQRSEAESTLLDLVLSLTGLPGNERHARLTPAVQAVLGEAVRPDYRLIYDPHEGVHLYTPSGLWVWCCPTCGADVEVLVTDTAAEPAHKTPS